MLSRCAIYSIRTISNVPKIAVIGSGPAGLYTCSAILSRLPKCSIDVIDKSPVPFGLVQFGVAPDHGDVKKCANYFEKMFDTNRDRLSLYCNVAVGSDVTYHELVQKYDAVILAYGASRARELKLENADVKNNVFSGFGFVSWYNGQRPDLTPNLDGDSAVIIGNGNVSIDCARVLLSDPERFRHTDIANYALKALDKSQIKKVTIVGRRGPLQVSFTIKELRELLSLPNANMSCQIPSTVQEEVRTKLSDTSISRRNRRIWELIMKYAEITETSKERTGSIEFFQKPSNILVNSNNQIESLELEHATTKEKVTVPCSLLIYAIGFQSSHLPGVPVDEDKNLLLDDWCRVKENLAYVYATGWCAKAGGGVIADTQRNAVLVAEEVVADLEAKKSVKPDESTVATILQNKNARFITWEDWKIVDKAEKDLGLSSGKVREKIFDVLSYLNTLRK